MRKKTTLGLIAGTLTVGVAGVAVAEQLSSEPASVASDAVVAPPAGPGNLGAAHQTSSSALRVHLERGGPEYLEGVDWGSARSFAIPGTRLRGWTFEQPGKRCLAMPDPIAEGYGVTCNTPQQVSAGKASVVILPPTDAKAPNIVGVLTSANKTAAIRTPSGAAAPWQRIGDIYAGTAPTGSRLENAGVTQAINPPTKEVVPPVAGP